MTIVFLRLFTLYKKDGFVRKTNDSNFDFEKNFLCFQGDVIHNKCDCQFFLLKEIYKMIEQNMFRVV
jgi:hypothetical protein